MKLQRYAIVRLSTPQTRCFHETCLGFKKGTRRPIYRCDEGAFVGISEDGPMQIEHMQHPVFEDWSFCTKCGHSSQEHLQILWNENWVDIGDDGTSAQYQQDVSEVHSRLKGNGRSPSAPTTDIYQEKVSDSEILGFALTDPEALIHLYAAQIQVIQKVAIESAIYLQGNALIPAIDPKLEYLDHLIDIETMRVRRGGPEAHLQAYEVSSSLMIFNQKIRHSMIAS